MAYIGKQPTPVPLSASDLNDDIISLAKMAGGTDGNLISYDTSGNPVAVATGSDGQVLTSAGAGNPCLFEAAPGGGKIGQVLQTVHTGVETIASTTMATISNFSRAITPAATSSKILVMPNMHIGLEATYCMGMILFRDTTEIFIGDAASSRDRNSLAGQYVFNEETYQYTICYLDSPSTTSEVVYSLKWNMQSGASIHFNRSYTDYDNILNHRRCASSFTVMEVLA